MTDGESIREALDLIPKGEFLLTASGGGRTNGVLVEFVGQCANNPPMLVVSTVKGQVLSPLIRDSRRFVLSIVTDATRSLARRFVRSNVETEDPFIGLPIEYTPSGIPVLTRSDAWFECELVRHLDIDADCELYVGLVRTVHYNGAHQDEEDSLRSNLFGDEVGVGSTGQALAESLTTLVAESG